MGKEYNFQCPSTFQVLTIFVQLYQTLDDRGPNAIRYYSAYILYCVQDDVNHDKHVPLTFAGTGELGTKRNPL